MVYRRGGVCPPDNASIVENVGTRRALSEEFKYYRFRRFTQILFLGTELTDITDATVLLLIINRGAPCFQRNPCLKKGHP